MKPSLFLILSVLMFLGCDKALELKDPINVFSVSMNGKPWEDNPPPVTNNQVQRPVKKIEGYYLKDCQDTTFFIRMVRGNYNNVEGYTQEELFINRIPLKIDDFQGVGFTPLCSQDTLAKISFYVNLEDASLRRYKLLTTEDNFFSIDSIDESEGIVTGNFQATFINKDDETDTVFFTDGRFQVMLAER